MKKLFDRGILVPSTSQYATNNIPVPKNKLLDGTSGGLRMASDFHALNSVPVDMAYPTEDVKTTVRWLATKRVY